MTPFIYNTIQTGGTVGEMMARWFAETQNGCHLVVVRRMNVLKYAVSRQLHLQHKHFQHAQVYVLRREGASTQRKSEQTCGSMQHQQDALTWDRPRWTDAVSEM